MEPGNTPQEPIQKAVSQRLPLGEETGSWQLEAYRIVGGRVFSVYGVLMAILVLGILLVMSSQYVWFLGVLAVTVLTVIFITGFGSIRMKAWSVLCWAGITTSLVLGMIIVPNGVGFWISTLFAGLLAGVGIHKWREFERVGVVGIVLAVVVWACAFLFVFALSQPERFDGPSLQEREDYFSRLFNPGRFLVSDDGKAILLDLYGYTFDDIVSRDIPDEEILKKIEENPELYNSYLAHYKDSLGGYMTTLIMVSLGDGLLFMAQDNPGEGSDILKE